jgi:5'-3' exonuclease
MSNDFILIDGSYFIFYRYYALLQWWSISKQEPSIENPSENERFVDLFRSTFIKKIKEIPKKLKIKNPIYIVGKDCPREKIWRNDFIDNYKGGRKSDNNVGYFFKLTYQEGLFEQSGIKTVLSYPGLEADDCLALTSKFIYENYNEHRVHIIANDMDYIQLCNDKIDVYNLKYKKISYISDKEEAEKYLFCKIVMGDKSDNIPSIFPKCGLKTAVKCYEDKEYFETKMNSFDGSIELYERNKKIIDFNMIPENLVNGFLESVINFVNK